MSALFVFGAWLALALLSADASESERVRVQRAPDGDSLLLADGRAVRLIGINAPELGKDGAPDAPLALAARERADALVGGHVVRLRYDLERRDRYGRTLAYAFLPDGRDLQELLLREGLGWFVAIPPNLAHLARYQEAEAQARGTRRGIWQHPAYQPLSAAQLTQRHTGFRLITGTVERLRPRGNAVEAQLAPGVQLLILGRQHAEVSRSLRGKRVLARGWLTEYKNGLRMRITHSAMLEVLP